MKESKFALPTVRIRQLSFSILRVAMQRPSSLNLKKKTDIAFLPVLDVVAVCDSSAGVRACWDGVLVFNFLKKISPVHVSSLKVLGVPFSLHQTPTCYTK